MLCADNNNNSPPVTLKSTKPILVYYLEPWCGPYRLSNPAIKEIVRQVVPKINIMEVLTKIAETIKVVSVPTVQVYYKGELLDTIVGCVAKNVLYNTVKKILEDLGIGDSVADDGRVSDFDTQNLAD